MVPVKEATIHQRLTRADKRRQIRLKTSGKEFHSVEFPFCPYKVYFLYSVELPAVNRRSSHLRQRVFFSNGIIGSFSIHQECPLIVVSCLLMFDTNYLVGAHGCPAHPTGM